MIGNLLSQVLACLINSYPLIRLYLKLHHCLSSFQIEYVFPCLQMLQYDAHSFGIRTEWKISQYLVLFQVPYRIHNHYLLLIPIHQFHPK